MPINVRSIYEWTIMQVYFSLLSYNENKDTFSSMQLPLMSKNNACLRKKYGARLRWLNRIAADVGGWVKATAWPWQAENSLNLGTTHLPDPLLVHWQLESSYSNNRHSPRVFSGTNDVPRPAHANNDFPLWSLSSSPWIYCGLQDCGITQPNCTLISFEIRYKESLKGHS